MTDTQSRENASLHPIPFVADAMRAIRAGNDEPYTIEQGDVARLESSLAKVPDSELPSAVFELCTFAGWLATEKKSPAAAESLYAVLETSIDELKRLGSDLARLAQEQVATARTERAKVTGFAEPLHDPKPAPEGSVGAGPLARFKLKDK